MKGRLVFENPGLSSIRSRRFGADPPLGPSYAIALNLLPFFLLALLKMLFSSTLFSEILVAC